MNKNLIVRFQKKDITWVSDTLFKVNPTVGYSYYIPFDFTQYYPQISSFFKRPRHFNMKGDFILTESLKQNFDRLFWDATTGNINVPSNPFIQATIPYGDRNSENYFFGMVTKNTLKKLLGILEVLGFLTILSTSSEGIKIKLDLRKINEILGEE